MIRLMLRRELRDRYPSMAALGGELLGLTASLLVYWYTARAFAPTFESGISGTSYFEFLILGETALFAPLALFSGTARSFRTTLANGTFEALLACPGKPQSRIALLAGALIPLELARAALTVASAWLFFGLRLSPSSLAGFALIQLLAAPAFLGLGFLAVALILRFGRGDSAVHSIAGVAAILGGAYFPVSVLPPLFQSFAGWSSPFALALEGTRAAFNAGSGISLESAALGLLAWGLVCLPAGWLALGASFENSRVRGEAPIVAS